VAEKDKVLTGEDEDKVEKDDLTIIETDAKGQPIEAEEDARVDAGADDKDDDKDEDDKSGRKRETHQERRERQRKARERTDREMRFLRSEVARLGTTVERLQTDTTTVHSQSLDERLSEALNDAETAERILAAAITANNGEDAVKAQRLRDEARQRAIEYHQQKQALNQPKKAEPPPYLPLAQEFAADKPWFTWDQSDEDSRMVLKIDSDVAKDGYAPTTKAYWQELERRVKAKLPHRYKKDDMDDEDEDEAPRRRGPMVGSGREHVPSSTRREAYISPDRKQAMMDAGVWDDPVLRKRYAKRYAEWDREHTTARR
jgi:hypothetical protein